MTKYTPIRLEEDNPTTRITNGLKNVVSGFVEIAGPVIEQYGPTLGAMATNFAASVSRSSGVTEMMTGSYMRSTIPSIIEIRDEEEDTSTTPTAKAIVEDLPSPRHAPKKLMPPKTSSKTQQKTSSKTSSKTQPPKAAPKVEPTKVDDLEIPSGVRINPSFYADIERLGASDNSGTATGIKSLMSVLTGGKKKS